MTQILEHICVALVSQILIYSARSLVLAAIALLAVTAFRAYATALRLFIWTSVLYASLALPFLGWLLPPVQVAALNSLQHRAFQSQVDSSFAETMPVARDRNFVVRPNSARQTVAAHSQNPDISTSPVANAPVDWRALPWSALAAAAYLMVMFLLLARFTAGVIFSRRLIRNAKSIPLSVSAMLKRQSGCRLAVSENISVPVTIGILKPTILLPPDYQEWDRAKLEAVLAHELSHVRSRDPLTQCVSLLYRAIFWINPLSWWLHRHLAALAEQASDEAALSCGADRNHYACTLLGFFETLQNAPGRVRWQGVSMARAGQAEKRLERILSWKGTVAMNLKRSLAVAILVVFLPVVFLAASVHSSISSERALEVNAQASAPPAPAVAPVEGIQAAAPIAGVPSVNGVPSIAPAAPMTLKGPGALRGTIAQHHVSESEDGNRYFYSYGYDDEERFVIASGKTDTFTMSGSALDARHVEKLKKQISGDFIWFQRDEKSYIIRDQATIDRARAFWAPQEELGKKQEELGKQQEELGKQQEELGAQMEQVKINVPDMTADLDRLKAKLQKLGPTATMEQVGDLQSEIGELQSKIGEIQSQAGEQQGKLGELQGALGEKQGKLGEQQGKLGEQQAELAEKATRQMKQLLDDAIKNGTAKPEEEIVKTSSL